MKYKSLDKHTKIKIQIAKYIKEVAIDEGLEKVKAYRTRGNNNYYWGFSCIHKGSETDQRIKSVFDTVSRETGITITNFSPALRKIPKYRHF